MKRVRLLRRREPLLTRDEFEFLDRLVAERLDVIEAQISDSLASESVLRDRFHAQDVQRKLASLGQSYRRSASSTNHAGREVTL